MNGSGSSERQKMMNEITRNSRFNTITRDQSLHLFVTHLTILGSLMSTLCFLMIFGSIVSVITVCNVNFIQLVQLLRVDD